MGDVVSVRQGKENVCADTLSRLFCNSATGISLQNIHELLSHPGVRRLITLREIKDLPFSTEEVKNVCSKCRICAEIKPQFYKPSSQHLIKCTQPMERLSIDFVGPKESSTRNKYFLTIVGEYSHFPFVFPCSDDFRNCDQLSLKPVLYNWMSWIYPSRQRETVSFERSARFSLIMVLLKVERLLTTHEESRTLSCGTTLPLWLRNPGPVFLRRYVRNSKNDPLVEEVDLVHCNEKYAIIRKENGQEDTVSLRDLAPIPTEPNSPSCIDSAEDESTPTKIDSS